MKKHLTAIIVAFAATALSSNAAISGSLKFLSPTTKQEVSSARIGRNVLVRVSVKDLNLLADKNVSLSYALSVTPKGSNTPTQISGKLSGRFVLPPTEGGLKKTKAEMAGWAGTQSASEILTIPDFMPVGVATLTVTLTTQGAGSISFNKRLNIVL